MTDIQIAVALAAIIACGALYLALALFRDLKARDQACRDDAERQAELDGLVVVPTDDVPAFHSAELQQGRV